MPISLYFFLAYRLAILANDFVRAMPMQIGIFVHLAIFFLTFIPK